jgi:hypothetical protein
VFPTLVKISKGFIWVGIALSIPMFVFGVIRWYGDYTNCSNDSCFLDARSMEHIWGPFLGSVAAAVLTFLICVAISEVIRVILAIETNTRSSKGQ